MTINHSRLRWAVSMAGLSHRRKVEWFLLIKSDGADPCWEMLRYLGGGCALPAWCVSQCYFGKWGPAVHTRAHTHTRTHTHCCYCCFSGPLTLVRLPLCGMWNERTYTWNKNKLEENNSVRQLLKRCNSSSKCYHFIYFSRLQLWCCVTQKNPTKNLDESSVSESNQQCDVRFFFFLCVCVLLNTFPNSWNRITSTRAQTNLFEMVC